MSRKLPEVLTDEEQEKFLNQFNTRYPSPHRNKVMFQLMLNTGLRVSEVVNLRWKDINLTSGKLMVREGKGAKDRTLWAGEDDLKRLQEWKERQVGKAGFAPEYVFTTLEGNQLTTRQVQITVKKYANKAGIDKHVTPHTLRHTFATDLYRETKNIRLVQKALGHADLSTTMIYTHIVDDELEEALKSFRGEERQPVRT